MKTVLEIDVGNTRLKWRRLAPSGTVSARGALSVGPGADGSDGVEAIAADGVHEARIGSVAGTQADRALESTLRKAGIENIRFARAGSRCGRLRAGYRQPERMGVDRWLALAAATHRLVGPLLVVDAGSALTLDLVDADGQHRGGWILPGLRMMRAALLSGTAGVRFDLPTDGAPGPGRDTAEAVTAGTLLMAQDFVAARWASFLAEAPAATLFLTGGDGALLDAGLPGRVLMVPDLVLDGLAPVLAETGFAETGESGA